MPGMEETIAAPDFERGEVEPTPIYDALAARFQARPDSGVPEAFPWLPEDSPADG